MSEDLRTIILNKYGSTCGSFGCFIKYDDKYPKKSQELEDFLNASDFYLADGKNKIKYENKREIIELFINKKI